MKWTLFLCLALPALSSFPETAWAAENRKGIAAGQRIEKYYYEAVPFDHHPSQKESIEMDFIEEEGGISYHSRGIASGSWEEISIQMDKEARFVSGTRSTRQAPDGPFRQEKIWRGRHKVVVERDTEGGIRRKEHRLPVGKELAVDGSLLALLRFFPFDEGKKWNLFMVDFSGYSVTVTILQEAREKIAVPAGEFECYRLATLVNIPVLKPKIIYWLYTQKPNFLVKHQGKRGPFTSFYTTSLISLE